MSKCGPNEDGGSLTSARAPALGQMTGDESVHNRFIEMSEPQVSPLV
jgi:hypothetical protein